MSSLDPTVRTRQLIECLLRENYELRQELDTRQQDIDRWRNLALAFCCPNECQDEMDRLLSRFLAKPWRE